MRHKILGCGVSISHIVQRMRKLMKNIEQTRRRFRAADPQGNRTIAKTADAIERDIKRARTNPIGRSARLFDDRLRRCKFAEKLQRQMQSMRLDPSSLQRVLAAQSLCCCDDRRTGRRIGKQREKYVMACAVARTHFCGVFSSRQPGTRARIVCAILSLTRWRN